MVLDKASALKIKKIEEEIDYRNLEKCFLEMEKCLLNKKQRLGESQANETGKGVKYCIKEVERSACLLRYGVKYINEEYKRKEIKYGNFNGEYIKKYICGKCILAISTFSSPYNSFILKMMGVLLAGGMMIFKPSPKAYNCSVEIYNLLENILIKYGFNNIHIVVGIEDNEVVELIRNLSFEAILFTGKSETAKEIKKVASGIPGIYETGSSALAYISHDYNPDALRTRLCNAGFAQSGMRCIALKNLFVNEMIYEKVKDILKTEIRQLRVGEAIDPCTDIGPIKDENTLRDIWSYLKFLENKGYETLIGGERQNDFLLPTLIEDKKMSSDLSVKEMYGPVLVIHRVRSFYDIPLNYYKRSSLQSSIYSNDCKEIQDFVRFNKWCGNICINYGPSIRIDSLPFGGMFDENEGRECLETIVKFVAKEQLIIKEKKYV